MTTPQIRCAHIDDLLVLVALEQAAFSSDRLSKRSFRHYIQSPQCALLVTELNRQIVAYGLVWHHKGTRLARLYSMAVHPDARRSGHASRLLTHLEQTARERGRLHMRLEVSKENTEAIALFQAHGYRIFGEYSDYYEDHSDALRMQKKIRAPVGESGRRLTPWYPQTMDFTCGPASLLMAMASFDDTIVCDLGNELDIWREATTVFMTSGHGGCHPMGLALAASRRGFLAEVWVSQNQALFLEGVRSEHKKAVMTLVHEQFAQRCAAEGITIHYADVHQSKLQQWLHQGYAVLVLISTYRLDGKKAPHWVVVTGADDQCFYLHDPDLSNTQLAVDCQHIPIAIEDFARMTAFGSNRLRTAVAIRPVSD